MKVKNYPALWAPLLALFVAPTAAYDKSNNSKNKNKYNNGYNNGDSTSDDTPVVRASTCENGILKQGAINIGIVIDNSGSTVDYSLGSGSDVGDINGDGEYNTILDAEIAAVLALLDEIKDSDELSNESVDIGLIIFSTVGEYEGIYSPLSDDGTKVNPVLVTKLKSIRSTMSGYLGYTNFDDALDKSIEFFSDDRLDSDRKNLMVFLSDGKPNVRGDGDVSMPMPVRLYLLSQPTSLSSNLLSFPKLLYLPFRTSPGVLAPPLAQIYRPPMGLLLWASLGRTVLLRFASRVVTAAPAVNGTVLETTMAFLTVVWGHLPPRCTTASLKNWTNSMLSECRLVLEELPTVRLDLLFG